MSGGLVPAPPALVSGSTESTVLDEPATLDRIIARIFRSPGLPETVAAIVEALVPAFAQNVRVLAEETPERSDPVGVIKDGTMSLTLTADGAFAGVLYLEHPTPCSASLLHAICALCARALASARRFEAQRQLERVLESAAMVSATPDVPGYRFHSAYETDRDDKPAGSSWYDAFTLSDGRFIVCAASVAAGGQDAAIAAITVRQTLRGVAHLQPDPSLMLQAAERTLYGQYPGRLVTAFVAVIDPVTQQCSWANAGHRSAYVRLPDGALRQLAGTAHALGSEANAPLMTVRHFALTPGSALVAYAQAVPDGAVAHGDAEVRLEALLQNPAFLQGDRIASVVSDVLRGTGPRRDVAVLVLCVENAVPVRRWRFDPQWSDVAQRVKRELCAALETTAMDESAIIEAQLGIFRTDRQCVAVCAGRHRSYS